MACKTCHPVKKAVKRNPKFVVGRVYRLVKDGLKFGFAGNKYKCVVEDGNILLVNTYCKSFRSTEETICDGDIFELVRE